MCIINEHLCLLQSQGITSILCDAWRITFKDSTALLCRTDRVILSSLILEVRWCKRQWGSPSSPPCGHIVALQTGPLLFVKLLLWKEDLLFPLFKRKASGWFIWLFLHTLPAQTSWWQTLETGQENNEFLFILLPLTPSLATRDPGCC